MAEPRHILSFDEIKDMLTARVSDVAYRYAPAVNGSYEEKGKYWTLNPGRADKSVGSFMVHVAGANAGHWNDYATGDHGDLLDLIALNLSCSISDALREARAFLGLQVASPDMIRKHQAAAARAKAQRTEAEKRDAINRAKGAARAYGLFLASQPDLTGTPVDMYLRDARGIDLSGLARPPRAIRYLADCYCQWTDPDTGLLIKERRPAMMAVINDLKGRAIGVHRTYLQLKGGKWGKADIPAPKKVMGDYRGCAIPVWKGIGPRGGKPGRLKDAGEGAHVYLAEGVEDALSVVMVLPEARVLAGISVSNLGYVELPPNVSKITLVADRDEGEQAQAALHLAIAQHQKAGRTVALWQNQSGGKDLNDALRTQQNQARKTG